MSKRLDKEREKELEPKRYEYAIKMLIEFGYEPKGHEGKTIIFYFKNKIVTLWVYSGWHSGKTIKAGRGIQKLLKQIQPTK